MKTHNVFIGGKWVDTGEYRDVVDPGTGKPFAKMAVTDRVGTKQAIDHAEAARAGWAGMTAMKRADILLAAASCLERRRNEIAKTISMENGKPYGQSNGEVSMSIDHLRWFAEEARRAYGRIVPHQADGKRHLIMKRPVGVTACISPWNFPLVLSARKVAPALAAGCPVILKPASQTPVCAVQLAECLEEAGIPKGVFQVVSGKASEIAAEFMENPNCRKISFTGSTEVGKNLIRESAKTVTKLSLELGGHAPVLVFDDADIEKAVDGALITKFRNTGQSCIAANRIYVQENIYEAFLKRFAEKANELKVGYGLEENVDIGAMVNREGLDAALAQVKNAVESGARVVAGGEAADLGGEHSGGYFLKPTVLADVPDDAECMLEETFAPVAPVTSFKTEEEAIEKANSTRYGLAAYAFTNDLNRTFRLAESLEAGTIGINDAVPSTSNCPFGGVKESGIGRELGSEGLDAFLETHHVSLGGVN
ncbi:MAG: NAD-dependent succinate-semialdehyde dehydrogenase [Spirochaetales bacterium]